MIRLFLLILGLCVFSSYCFAEDNSTVVYGAAETPDGGQNVFVVTQPENAPNPLGDPIVGPNKPVEVFGDVYNSSNNKNMSDVNSENVENQKNLGNDFENTLLEANDRVYDIQSYPKADFKVMENPANPQTIYSPNVNN